MKAHPRGRRIRSATFLKKLSPGWFVFFLWVKTWLWRVGDLVAGSCLTQVVCNEIGVTLIWVFAQLCAPGEALPVLLVLLHLPKSENLGLSVHKEYFISFPKQQKPCPGNCGPAKEWQTPKGAPPCERRYLPWAMILLIPGSWSVHQLWWGKSLIFSLLNIFFLLLCFFFSPPR